MTDDQITLTDNQAVALIEMSRQLLKDCEVEGFVLMPESVIRHMEEEL